jgi:radical SAM superfamily enzyme YgiQ (UPF0313 family)
MRNMKVLLISPNTEKTEIPVSPMGLACVAAAARQAGHEVLVVDMMPAEASLAQLGERLRAFSPDVVGVSVRNIDDQNMEQPRFLLPFVREVIAACRRGTAAPVVVGGAGYSIFPESALAYLGADMGLQGEGELAFPALLAALAEGGELSRVPGLYLPGRGRQGERSFARTLDELPFPAVGDLAISPEDRHLWVQVQSGRGCPLGCSYCSTEAVEGRVKRKRSPAVIVRELAHLVALGFRRFYFVDNTFNLPLAHAKEVCRQIIAARLDVKWMCIIYPGFVDTELVDLLARAGCTHVSLGFESGSPEILARMHKRFLPDGVRAAARLLAEAGIRQMGFLMFGGPGETRETVEESIALAEELPLETVKVTIGIRIYPDTDLARTAVARGLIAADDPLLEPRFYCVPELEGWLQERVRRWAAARPNWIV